MSGYTAEEVYSGRVGWVDMTPPEWRSLDERAIEQLREKGVAVPWEKEYLRKDGTRVPILVGVAMLDASKGECVAFILDQTDRKDAESALERMRKEREAGLEESIRARDDFLEPWRGTSSRPLWPRCSCSSRACSAACAPSFRRG